MKVISFVKSLTTLSVFVICTVGLQPALVASADAGSDYSISSEADGHTCEKQSIMINDAISLEAYPYQACVIHGRGIDIAHVYLYGYPGNDSVVGVRNNHEEAFARIQGLNGAYFLPDSNTLFFNVRHYYSGNTSSLFILDNVDKTITPQKYPGSDYTMYYSVETTSSRSAAFPSQHPEPWYMRSYAISKNGKYSAIYTKQRGLFLVNIQTGVIKKILNDPGDALGWERNEHVSVVSDNGRFILLGNRGLIVDTANCGIDIKFRSSWDDPNHILSNECSKVDISSKIMSTLPMTQWRYNINNARFIENGGALEFDVKDVSRFNSESQWRVIQLPSNTDEELPETPSHGQLEYLALGDSFSSGEGDPGHYVAHTDDDNGSGPKELCHLGDRSYPFLLANGMDLGARLTDGTQKWGSVACAGALTSDIDGQGSDEYMGQGSRLNGFLDSGQLKLDALNEMIPGRQKQIEFVKKYRPRAVTLTAGGNDTLFSKVVIACVSPYALGGGELAQTCSYAKDDQKKVNIGSSILNLRGKLTALYTELKSAGDPNVKLYVLGYPQFVSDQVAKTNSPIENAKTCGLNVRLNYDERRMVVESTKFLNSVIRSAADEAGAIYVDTESALVNHQLCDSSPLKAVNGITGVVNNSESFHPNSYGHSLMAIRVWEATGGETLQDYVCRDGEYTTCPGGSADPVVVPDYFKSAMKNNSKAIADGTIAPDVLKVGSLFLLLNPTTAPNFIANSAYKVLLYSSPTELGSFATDGDGSIRQEIKLPSTISPGYHTLEIQGTGLDGKPLTIWKIIEVRSDDDNDYDGDGAPNASDQCQYIQPAGVDMDKDGIDDGCDLDAPLPSGVVIDKLFPRIFESENQHMIARNQSESARTSEKTENLLLANDNKGSTLEPRDTGVLDATDDTPWVAKPMTASANKPNWTKALTAGVALVVVISAILILWRRNLPKK